MRQIEIAGKLQELNNVLVFRIWMDLPATHALRQTVLAGKQQELNKILYVGFRWTYVYFASD